MSQPITPDNTRTRQDRRTARCTTCWGRGVMRVYQQPGRLKGMPLTRPFPPATTEPCRCRWAS